MQNAPVPFGVKAAGDTCLITKAKCPVCFDLGARSDQKKPSDAAFAAPIRQGRSGVTDICHISGEWKQALLDERTGDMASDDMDLLDKLCSIRGSTQA